MNVNIFFTAAAILLAGMFLFIRPVNVEKADGKEIPELDLTSFTIYELDRNGLARIMYGDEGQRFKKRYEVTNIAYSDSRNALTQDMTAEHGLYRGETMTLTGDVLIRRSDGLNIKTDKASYNKKSGVVKSHGPFLMTQGLNRAAGENLVYNTNAGRGTAAKIKASYEMPDKGTHQ